MLCTGTQASSTDTCSLQPIKSTPNLRKYDYERTPFKSIDKVVSNYHDTPVTVS